MIYNECIYSSLMKKNLFNFAKKKKNLKKIFRKLNNSFTKIIFLSKDSTAFSPQKLLSIF